MLSRLIVQVVANLIIALVVVILGARIHHLSLSIGQYGLVLLISILGGAMFLCIGQAVVRSVKILRNGQLDRAPALHRPHLPRAPAARAVRSAHLGHRGPMESGGDGHDALRRRAQPVRLEQPRLSSRCWPSSATSSRSAVIGIRWFQWEVR